MCAQPSLSLAPSPLDSILTDRSLPLNTLAAFIVDFMTPQGMSDGVKSLAQSVEEAVAVGREAVVVGREAVAVVRLIGGILAACAVVCTAFSIYKYARSEK